MLVARRTKKKMSSKMVAASVKIPTFTSYIT